MSESKPDLGSGLTISLVDETIWPLMPTPEKYVIEQEARISTIDSDHVLGWIHFTFIDIGSCLEDEEELREVFDTDGDLWELRSALFDGDELSKRAKRAMGETRLLAPPGLLYFQRAEVLPQYRGHDLALRSIAGIIDRFRASVGCVVMKPYPLQFEELPLDPPPGGKFSRAELDLVSFRQCREAAFGKLEAHYRRLGFNRVGGSRYFVVDPINCRLTPDRGTVVDSRMRQVQTASAKD